MLHFNQGTIYSILCAVLPCVIYFMVKRKNKNKLSWLFVWIFVLYIWQIYDLTGVGGLSDILYAPQGGINESIIQAKINLIPFDTIERSFYLNILMLVPFGFLAPFIWKNFRKIYKTVLLGAGFSLLIELSQLITTRTSDINDVIANTMGAFIGYSIWKVFSLCCGRRLKKPIDSKWDLIWYILLSFSGMFFLYYPFWFSRAIAPLIWG